MMIIISSPPPWKNEEKRNRQQSSRKRDLLHKQRRRLDWKGKNKSALPKNMQMQKWHARLKKLLNNHRKRHPAILARE